MLKKSTASERFAAFFLRPNLAAGACGKNQQQLADRIAECQRTDGDGTGAGGRTFESTGGARREHSLLYGMPDLRSMEITQNHVRSSSGRSVR